MKGKVIMWLLSASLLLAACVSKEQLCNRGLGLIVQQVELGNGQKIRDYVSEKIGETDIALVYEARGEADFCLVQFWQGDASEGKQALTLEINMESGHISAGDSGGDDLMNLLMNAFVPLPE